LATESLSFIRTREAALAMIRLAAEGSPVKSEAARWALMRMTGFWSGFNVRAELKKSGVYDPEKITVSPVQMPAPAAPTYGVRDVLAKTGDASRGAQLAQRCTMCHEVAGKGVAYGPELRTFFARQGRESTVKAIVEPSADIALGYDGTTLKLKNGAGSIDGRLHCQQRPLGHHLGRRGHPAGPQGPRRRAVQAESVPDDVRRAAGSDGPGRGRHRGLVGRI